MISSSNENTVLRSRNSIPPSTKRKSTKGARWRNGSFHSWSRESARWDQKMLLWQKIRKFSENDGSMSKEQLIWTDPHGSNLGKSEHQNKMRVPDHNPPSQTEISGSIMKHTHRGGPLLEHNVDDKWGQYQRWSYLVSQWELVEAAVSNGAQGCWGQVY